MSHKDAPVQQLLLLKNGEEIRGRILSYLNGEFVVKVPTPKGKGYDRRPIPFGDVHTVTNVLAENGGSKC